LSKKENYLCNHLKEMKINKNIKKFGFRLLVVIVVFFFVKLTIDADECDQDLFGVHSLFYFLSALFFFLGTWELNDWFIKRQLAGRNKKLNWRTGLIILGKTLVIVVPVFALVYYAALFHFDDVLQINSSNPALQFRSDLLRASMLALTTIVFNLLYFAEKVRKKLEIKLDKVERELLDTKYKSLKSQISPHFLFNSLNTLTALMYEDRDLASDFVTRLSSCYRYILDNRESDLVRLDKELQFLDSFIFMMDVRHKMSVQITTKIDVEARDYFIPTLSLQMLVENALKHNYYSNEQPLIIAISVTDEVFIVENTLRKRKEVEPSTQLGIDNIKKRYSHYTNKKVQVIEEANLFKVTLASLGKDMEQKPHLQIVS